MAKFIIKRLLLTIPIILIVAVLIFTVMYFSSTPDETAVYIAGTATSGDLLESIKEAYGLNDSYLQRLGDFMYSMFIKFDLGTSWVVKTQISSDIASRLPRTTGICIFSILVSVFIGIPLGVTSAIHQDKAVDKVVLVGSSILRCLPHFFIALMFVLIFSVSLNWLPAFGIDQGIVSYVLPCASIMLVSLPLITRQMRASMLEVIRSDYVVAAQAQGFSDHTVYYKQALPNALIPILTLLGTQFASGLGGTIIIETIFAIPGMGSYIQTGINQHDFPIVTGSVTLLAIIFCIVMLLIDISYAIVDPRIRTQYESNSKRERNKNMRRARANG